MRTRSLAPLLAACAYALAAAAPAAGGDAKPIQVTAVVQPTMAPAVGTLTTKEGQQMALELAELETALIKHLKGEQPSSFEVLDAKRKALKARLDGAGLAAGDKKILDERLGRAASVITRSLRLTGGGAAFDPEVSRAVRSVNGGPKAAPSKDPLYEIDVLLGDLDRASANPAEAEKIFDNLNRRYGSPNAATGGVPVNFGAIRKTLADTWSYTPKGAPGTNAAKAKNLSKDTPAPQVEPVVVRGVAVDYLAMLSLTSGRAANAIAEKLPDGEDRRFIAERSDRLKELFDAGRRAVRAMGGDPDTFPSIDALVAHLSNQEKGLAASMKLADNFESMDEVMLRVSAIKSVNRELGAFMAVLWEYRGFLRTRLVEGTVPIGTKFTPWETYPDGVGTKGAQVQGLSRGVTEFVGLRYDNPDGSSRFQGQAKNGRSGLIVAFDKAKKRTESLIGYDADGKVQNALTEIYDGAKLTHREKLNMATGLIEVTDFKADGTELKSSRRNTKTGEQFVRDLSGNDNRFEATTKDGRREIKFLKDANGAPPAISLRIEKVGTDGSFELDRLVLQNGTHIVVKSPHVNQLLENGTKSLGWDVSIKALVETTDTRKRLLAAKDIAHEAVLAVGMNDDKGRLSIPLANFLASEAKNTGDLVDPKNGAPVRFFINDGQPKNFMLIFTRRDGSQRILSGSFKQATEFGGNYGLGMAFGMTGEIEIDASKKATQNDPKITTEFLNDGSRLVWLPPVTTTYSPSTWYVDKLWKDDHEKTEFKVRRDFPPDPSRAEWNPDGVEWLSKADTIDRELSGTSGFGSAARWVASVPGVKQVLGFCGDVASTLYTGIVSGGQMLAYEITGNETYRLEATAGYSRNPGVKLLMGGSEPDREKDPVAWRKWKDKMNEEYLSRIGGGDNKETLDKQAKERREKALALQGITERRAPQAYHDAMNAPVSDDERFDALSDFGAGTYGRRLAENGHEFWGGVMSFSESLGEGMLNPLMYVIPGIGRLAGAAGKLGLAATSPTIQVVARVAEFGLRGFQYALLGSVVGSFALSALDNIGKAAQYWGTPNGSVKAGEAMADLAFGGLMLKGFAKERTKDGLAELKTLSDGPGALEIKPTTVETAVKATAETPVVKTEGVKTLPKTDVKADAKTTTPAVEGVEAPKPSFLARLNTAASTFWSELKRGGDAFSEKTRPDLQAADIKSPTHAEANGATGAALDAKSAELKGGDVKTEVKTVETTPDVKSLDAKSADVKTADAKTTVDAKTDVKSGDVKTVDAKTADLKTETKTEAKGDVKNGEMKSAAELNGKIVDAKMETKAELKSETKSELKDEAKGKKGELKDETAKKEDLKEKDEEKKGRANFREESKSKSEVREETREEAREEGKGEEKRGRFRRAADWLGEKAEKGSRWIEKRPIMKLARGGVILPITPAMKRNMRDPDGDRRRGKKDPGPPKKTVLDPVEEPSDGDPKKGDGVAPNESTAEDSPEENGSGTTNGSKEQAIKPLPPPKNGPPSGRGAGGGGGGGGAPGGDGDGGGPSGKGPKSPSFGGFGDKGGGGGGGGAGAPGGFDGGGGHGGDAGGPGGAGGGSHGGPDVSAEAPADLRGGGSTLPVSHRGKTSPNDAAVRGGHSPSPSLASRFDGSHDRTKPAEWSPSAMKGLGAGDSLPLPTLGQRAAALTAPAAGADAAPVARTAGSAAAGAPGAGATGVKPEDEDFSYTYLAPARHKYELPEDRPAEGRDWRELVSLGLRGAAALAVAYLIYHSDLPYLVGFTRRRRDGTYGA